VTAENYYQAKASKCAMTPIAPVVIQKPTIADPLTDLNGLMNTLRVYGCEIPEENLKSVLNVLVATDKLKDIVTAITGDANQQAMLDLEQALNVVERKLQHEWEFNGFKDEDDAKFKGFLTWRRVLKGAIFFWKKLYQTNTIVELQKAWHAYTSDPSDKPLMAGDRIDSKMKRYQITTDSISTIFNSRRPFTRIFYATSEEEAYKQFVKWMSDRQLHEDKSKTTIVELTPAGEDGRKEED
jgi:predicted transcriptional regulator